MKHAKYQDVLPPLLKRQTRRTKKSRSKEASKLSAYATQISNGGFLIKCQCVTKGICEKDKYVRFLEVRG